MTLKEKENDGADEDTEQEQRELYESLPEPDLEENPYPDLDELERTPAGDFYES